MFELMRCGSLVYPFTILLVIRKQKGRKGYLSPKQISVILSWIDNWAKDLSSKSNRTA